MSLIMEEAVIGCLLCDPSHWPTVSKLLNASSFQDKRCKTIWWVMEELMLAGKTITVVDVAEQAETQDGRLEAIGGLQGLCELAFETANPSNIMYFASQLRSESVKRDLLEACKQMLVSIDSLEDAKALHLSLVAFFLDSRASSIQNKPTNALAMLM